MMRSYPQWPSLEEVAEKLGTSPSSLQRHLAAQHTSAQWLKDDLRRDLAISRLSTSRVSLVQLASELGFSDSPTFQRAFKRWTGKNCRAYRRNSDKAHFWLAHLYHLVQHETRSDAAYDR